MTFMKTFKLLPFCLLTILSIGGCNSSKDAGTNPVNNTPTVTTISMSECGLKESVQPKNFTKNGYKFTVAQNSGQSAPYYSNDGELRLYVSNTLTIEGLNFTSINFEISTSKKGTWECSTGVFDGDNWSGDASKLTITILTKQFRVLTLTITGIGEEDGGGTTSEHTAENAITEICNNIGEGSYDPMYDEDDESYYTWFDTDYDSEENFEQAYEEGILFIPEYFYSTTDPDYETAVDEDLNEYPCYGTIFYTEDNSVVMTVYAYFDEDDEIVYIEYVAIDIAD